MLKYGVKKRVGASLGAVAIALVSATATTPAAEAAYPSSCGWGYDSLGRVSAWCNVGSGSVRAVEGCNRFGWAYTVYGSWVGVGRGVSTTSGCGAFASPTWGGFNISA